MSRILREAFILSDIQIYCLADNRQKLFDYNSNAVEIFIL